MSAALETAFSVPPRVIMPQLALVALALVPGQVPPKTHATWCADVHQYLSVNGTVKHSTRYHLCLDMKALRWARKSRGLEQYFNGTTRFDVLPNGTCVATYFGPAQPTQFPWHMIEVDANATFNRTEHGVDGFKTVNVWSLYRPARTKPGHFPAQQMEWRIENTSKTAVKEFLSSSCIQQAFPPAPPGLMQDGVRDFSGNYTTPAPSRSRHSSAHVMPPLPHVASARAQRVKLTSTLGMAADDSAAVLPKDDWCV